LSVKTYNDKCVRCRACMTDVSWWSSKMFTSNEGPLCDWEVPAGGPLTASLEMKACHSHFSTMTCHT